MHLFLRCLPYLSFNFLLNYAISRFLRGWNSYTGQSSGLVFGRVVCGKTSKSINWANEKKYTELDLRPKSRNGGSSAATNGSLCGEVINVSALHVNSVRAWLRYGVRRGYTYHRQSRVNDGNRFTSSSNIKPNNICAISRSGWLLSTVSFAMVIATASAASEMLTRTWPAKASAEKLT